MNFVREGRQDNLQNITTKKPKNSKRKPTQGNSKDRGTHNTIKGGNKTIKEGNKKGKGEIHREKRLKSQLETEEELEILGGIEIEDKLSI